MAAAQRLTAPGSLAERYAVASEELAKAVPDAGEGVPPTTITRHGSELQACTAEDTTTPCATFAAFRSDRHGRLVSFTINHLSLAGRFAIDDGQSDAALGVTGNLDIAYESPTPPTLFMMFRVRGAPDGARAVDVSSATSNPTAKLAGRTPTPRWSRPVCWPSDRRSAPCSPSRCRAPRSAAP